MGKENIKTTDWLTGDMTEEQIARKKQEAIMAADLELCMSFDLWMERETDETTVDYDYVAEKMYDIGYRKQVEAEWTPIEEFVPNWGANIIHHYECSNCKTLEYTNDRKYCPNCGAKMRNGE